jgi:hypothetical protein
MCYLTGETRDFSPAEWAEILSDPADLTHGRAPSKLQGDVMTLARCPNERE